MIIVRYSLYIVTAAFCVASCLVLFPSCTVNNSPEIVPNDTTSHAFSVIRIDTLGNVFSNARDVDIVSENNIWVAGAFTKADGNGSVEDVNNLAHWNGTVWEMFAVKLMGYNNTGPTLERLLSVRIVNDSTIYVLSAATSFGYSVNGVWKSFFIDPEICETQAMWIRGVNDVFFIGEQGAMAHWDGKTVTKIVTNVSRIPLKDIGYDGQFVYAVGYSNYSEDGTETVFLHGDEGGITVDNRYKTDERTVPPPTQYQFMGQMTSVYCNAKTNSIWLAGGEYTWFQIYRVTSLSPFRAEVSVDLPQEVGLICLRGTADNDLYAVHHSNGIFYHYNGSSWMKYEPPVKNFGIVYDSPYGFSVRNNVWAMAGYEKGVIGKAIVIIGKHWQ